VWSCLCCSFPAPPALRPRHRLLPCHSLGLRPVARTAQVSPNVVAVPAVVAMVVPMVGAVGMVGTVVVETVGTVVVVVVVVVAEVTSRSLTKAAVVVAKAGLTAPTGGTPWVEKGCAC
jgi:hypothetical protein